MVTETHDRRVNTDAKIRNDGVKRLPHERDEAPEGQHDTSHGVMRQAADDLEQGLVDTDLHGERGVEQAVARKGSGQARPQADNHKDMREHDSTIASRGGKQ